MIKSTDREVRALIDALGSSEARREAAVARLIIIGPRAIARLIEAFQSSRDRLMRLAVLRVLEAIGDDRALAAARDALEEGSDLAVAAVGVLRELIGRGSLPVQGQALDLLVAASQAPACERRVRLAAAQVVAEVSQLVGPSPTIRAADMLSASEAVWADAADGRLPDAAQTLREAADEHAPDAPLPVVHRIIEHVRAREAANGVPDELQGGWRRVRGALHQALALRGSRIALYDLRETVAACRAPLPDSYLAALRLVGDDSCLEPVAAAFASADDGRWRHELAVTFQCITKRERLTTRHSAVRRALARAPGLKGG